ncbi:glutamine amidotransferase [Leucobacter sp. CSA2]|uniref:Glutamine amidotransferase n=1 Tax=Leucobacter edaphi TaxID=2796472 RepID=A0A934QDU4_9MICO|nr:glutamine amidotransferase [Leucobacter edaphi]MBK0421237.1 glutamine amidotransferase [Leucobacter edaphi]
MKPFLLITTRGEDDVAAEEHASFCRLTGLLPEDLVWLRADQVPLGAIDFAGFSGIILAGSPFTVSEPVERKSAVELRVERELGVLLDEVVRVDMPFLGICYGIGTIGAHQGARVDRTYGETSQAVTISLTAEGQADPLFTELPAEFDAFVGHKEAISEVPDSITVLASSPSCPVQAFRVGRNVYATQFHPELDVASFTARVRAYADHGYFEPHELETIIARVDAADVRAAHMVLGRFVEEYIDSRPVTPPAKPGPTVLVEGA